MSTIDKMKTLKDLLGDKYYYYLGTMVMDGFEIKETVDYLYSVHFGNQNIKQQNKKNKTHDTGSNSIYL